MCKPIQWIGILIVGMLLVSCGRVKPSSEIYTALPTGDKYVVYTQNGKYGYMDQGRKLVIKAQFDDARGFVDDLASVKLNGKWGCIDTTGKMVIPPQYNYVGVFSEGLAAVEQNQKFGFMDKSGKIIIPLKYAGISHFSDGLASVCLWGKKIKGVMGNDRVEGKWCYIDKTGKVVINELFEDANDFKEGLASVRIGEGQDEDVPPKSNYFTSDVKGKGIDNSAYSNISVIDNFRYMSHEDRTRYGFIDKSGKYILKPQYHLAGSFSEGLAPVWMNGKWCYIDKTGKVIIHMQCSEAGEFSDGFAKVLITKNLKTGEFHRTGKWGYIDKTGTMVIQPQYDDAGDFTNGLAQVKMNGDFFSSDKWMVINKAGTVVKSQ